ncbi:squalene/phytoene synthase family protein [Falsiroseomonas selenitidurans]|uniref:Squalene/phytoene synthase family protein n=1 Tax=Falsiroseomonas selenitidurans TaxID=2716335 RepID=A0ABX1E7K7_9PROT|nr:squalene/phytoene synthase family protein [Falsiroseomonas selenitidurans]NKC32758.1 squalene/phytoene synthase family protein [Falsiroseomonas selenitidurans]
MDGADLAAGPPSRTETGENFPVASRLLPPPLRPLVLAFYRFARQADDIADAPGLAPAEKLARLAAMEALLDRPDGPLAATGTAEARRLLSAFRQDSVQDRYPDWAALEDYCARSAAPVGRMLLRLHGEDAAGAARASDALCAALQVLNHLQDLVPDRQALGRVYLPTTWMALAGGEDGFFAAQSPARRAVLDAALDRVEAMLEQAAPLPRLLRSRLRRQAQVTLDLGWRLLARLRAADPVAGRVALRRADFAAAFAGLARAPRSDAQVVRARVARAGSSFGRGMAVLKGDRLRALHAVYGFCRAVDDIADGAMPEAEKRRFLAQWRARLAAPDCALSAELAWARAAFGLPEAECAAMIDGMETDATPGLRLADEAALDLYCRRVAGSVGVLAVRIFGAPGAVDFGLALGRTFQLVNILRDVDEDARIDRVYVPETLRARHGVAGGTAAEIVAHPGFAACCEDLAARAAAGFERAERALRALDARAMKPARVMMWGYHRLLHRMLANGFAHPRRRARLRRGEKLQMAARALLP